MKSARVIGLGLALWTAAGAVAQVKGGADRPQLILPGDPGWVSPEPLPLSAPSTVCFIKGTDPLYAQRWQRFVELQNQAFFGLDYYTTGRWSGTLGQGRTLTWSFVPDGLSIGNGIGEPTSPSALFSTMDSGFASQGGRATWINRFQQVFDRWHALTGITYQRITVNGNDWDDGAAWGSGGSSTRGDVRISMHTIDGASNVLAYCNFPSNGDMVLDQGDIGNFASSANQNRFLRNVVAHEHGHGIGLLHVCTNNSQILMEPFIDNSYDGPRQDDIRGAQYLYGDPFEINDTAAAATPIGAVSIGTPLTFAALPNPVTGTNDSHAALLSIEAPTRVDWYSFTTTVPMNLTVTANPVGSTYDMAQQGSGCPTSGSPMNALAAATLAIDVYDSNGTTLLGTATASAAGQPASAADIAVSGAGTRYVKVRAAAWSSLQSYNIQLAGQTPCPVFTQQPGDQTACETSEVTISVVVAGSPTPTLQWRHNNVEIPGATQPDYVIQAATPLDAGTYDVVATNSCGTTTSTPATLTILALPVFTQQPQSQTIPVGSPVTFNVQLATNEGITLRWRKNGTTIPGATSTSYTIQSVQPSDAGVYDVQANFICGNVLSQPATLTVGTVGQCYANCDGSTTQPILNVNDFICFQANFAAGSSYANCDGSTTAPVLNVNDFICFQTQFAQGCP